jgi:hypothetical protein
MDLHIGSLVEHSAWGRGKILALRQPNAEAFFPSLALDVGGSTRIVRLSSLSLSPEQSDPRLDHIGGKSGHSGTARARRPIKKAEHDLSKAIEWFESEYPARFADERFVKDEVGFKRAAHTLFVDRLGNGLGEELLKAGNAAEVGTLLDALYQQTNIPSRFEIMAAHDGLKDPDAASRVLEGLLALLATPGPVAFAKLADAVGALPAPAKGSKALTWPNVTILPFLADPSRFIVAKPEITKQVAARMGLDLFYSTAVRWDTYDRVLDMSRRLLETLAPIGATDFIDVQSFVWATRKLT